ncbi:MgtC/SapB family protein [Streptomyces sp. NPDC057545]|uniref:MgtC/SapB family protein n=1 Tax=Streptomyces sp. NPDC057545 TaxID=3346164 RepID=UPI0036C26D79
MASYVVSGIRFLGGGVILRDGAGVRGLNTAATLWCSAAVGVLAASGRLALAALGTLTVLGIHLLLRPAGRLLDRAPAAGSDPDAQVTGQRAPALRAAVRDPHPGPARTGPDRLRADRDRAAGPPRGPGHHQRAG